ncbi:MAG TPA: GTPase RsgA, partial [Gammaproteobacteria bacterium]|nr:GTPase RsgA [Gammaproteobacteria bacterium]
MNRKNRAPLKTGRVIVNFRRQSDIETDDGAIVNCMTKGRRLQPVCGDIVQWRPLDDNGHEDNNRGVIEAIEPRRSLLFRYDPRKQQQPLAANLDQLLIVSAPQPTLEPFLIDKYLVAAEAINVTPVIVLNKIDLLTAPDQYNGLLAEYQQLGYTTLQVSAENGTGM